MFILEWSASLCGILGLWFAAKHSWGWLLCALASILWFTFGLLTQTYGLMTTTVAWLAVEVGNYFRVRE